MYKFFETKILITTKTNGVKNKAKKKLFIPLALFIKIRICFNDSKSVKNIGTKIKIIVISAMISGIENFTARERYAIMYANKKKKKNDKSQSEKIKIFTNVTKVNKNP